MNGLWLPFVMRQRGWVNSGGYSLVELMIALALGSIVTTGVVQLFIANSETYNVLVAQSRMQESARFALDFISREARRAGYKGCYSSNKDFYSTISESNIPYEFDMRFGIQGFEGSKSQRLWVPALTRLPHNRNTIFATSYGYGTPITGQKKPWIKRGKVITGTDVVTFRYLDQTQAHLVQAMPNATANPMVAVAKGWDAFNLEHLVMIHDCEKSALFKVTSENPWDRNPQNKRPEPADKSYNFTITHHDPTDTTDTRNIRTKLAPINTFSTDASVSAIQAVTFFITKGPKSRSNNAKRRILSLWAKYPFEPPVELVEGVEDLQILYGIDNADADRAPNQYKTAATVTDWTQVVTVRITIVVNSVNTVGTKSEPTHGCAIQGCVDGKTWDGLNRKSFSQTVRLRNHG